MFVVIESKTDFSLFTAAGYAKFQAVSEFEQTEVCFTLDSHKNDNLMNIENSQPEDIDSIFRLYELASEHQKSVSAVVVRQGFERGLVEREIAENRQWKLTIDDRIACIWATTLSDEQNQC